MNGWLVYSPAGIERNRWFADHLIEAAKTRGISLELKIFQEDGGMVCLTPSRIAPSGRAVCPHTAADIVESSPDFAIMRMIRPDLSERFESKGVRVVNNAATSRVANDKWRTFILARELGLPVMDTFHLTFPQAGDGAGRGTRPACPRSHDGALPGQFPPGSPTCGFPCVVKSLDGHGGSEVAFAEDAAQLARFAAGCGKREFIAQPMCSDPGRDVRVYAFRDEAIAAVLRTSMKDFRSNFSLGGEVNAVAPTDEQREIVRVLHKRLGFDFAGVDFIFHEGKWILNEIEDVVGCRMLYATTGIDAASLLVNAVDNGRIGEV